MVKGLRKVIPAYQKEWAVDQETEAEKDAAGEGLLVVPAVGLKERKGE